MFISSFSLLVALFNSTAAIQEDAAQIAVNFSLESKGGKTVIKPGRYNGLKLFYLCGRAYTITIIVPKGDGENVKVSVTRNSEYDHQTIKGSFDNLQISILNKARNGYIAMYTGSGDTSPRNTDTTFTKNRLQDEAALISSLLYIQGRCNIRSSEWEAYLKWVSMQK